MSDNYLLLSISSNLMFKVSAMFLILALAGPPYLTRELKVDSKELSRFCLRSAKVIEATEGRVMVK